MAIYQKRKPYNTDIQVQAMRARYPQFLAKKNKNGEIIFTGQLQVKPELPVYTLRVIYRGDDSPQIFILEPVPLPDAPHIYGNTGSLCLYHKNNYSWNERRLIATEIMGWTAGWIYFYEYWLQTGDWVGPEVSHHV
jgi:hypothetical protein